MKYYLVGNTRDTGMAAYNRFHRFMVLAQHLIGDPQYFDMVKKLGGDGASIMMDNGAAEHTVVNHADMFAMARELDVDEVIMPDVMGDAEASLKLLATYYTAGEIPYHKMAVVIHGKTIGDVRAYIDELFKNYPHVRTWCVPKYMDHIHVDVGGLYPPPLREWVLQDIYAHTDHYRKAVHLLGCNTDPVQSLAYYSKRYPWIRSVDTASPLTWAQAGLKMDEKGMYSYDWTFPTPQDLGLYNLQFLRRICNAPLYK